MKNYDKWLWRMIDDRVNGRDEDRQYHHEHEDDDEDRVYSWKYSNRRNLDE